MLSYHPIKVTNFFLYSLVGGDQNLVKPLFLVISRMWLPDFKIFLNASDLLLYHFHVLQWLNHIN